MLEKFKERKSIRGTDYALERFISDISIFLDDIYKRIDKVEKEIESLNRHNMNRLAKEAKESTRKKK